MADFVTLNRYTVPIKDGSVEMTEIMIGETERSFSGQMRSTRRTFKRRWSMETTILPQRTAYTVRKILEGGGFNIPFRTDLYATNGLNPNFGYHLTFNLGGGPNASNSITLASSVLAYNAFDLSDLNGWTIMVDKKVSGVWTRFAKTLSGAVYTNGILTGTAPWITAPAGVATLTYSASDTDFANLVLLPWEIDADFALDWGGVLTSKLFPDLPQLKMEGELNDGSEVITGYGILDSMTPVQASIGGSFNTDNMTVSFTIDEA